MNIPALMFNEGGWCEALKTSYAPGRFQPASVEEFKALAPFARKPVPQLEAEIVAGLGEIEPDDGKQEFIEAVAEVAEPVAEKPASVAPAAPRKPRRK